MEAQLKTQKRGTVSGALKNLLLLVCVVGLGALVTEGMVRLFIDDGISYELEMWKYARDVKVRDLQPDLGHRHGENREARLMGVDVRTNAFGFRGPELVEQAEPGVARIAFVGDSTTLGWGVAEQDTFAHRVIADLSGRGWKVDGYNLGVGNLNATQELALFRKIGARMKPDIIVLTYFINDAEPMPNYGQDSWLDRHSVAWIVLRYRIDSIVRQFGSRPEWKEYYRNLYADDAPGWRAAQKAIGEFAAISRQSGATLLVFHLPELRELKPYPFADVTAKVRKSVEQQGLPFIDLLPTVEQLAPATLWVTVPDPHPNANANAAFTRGMIQTLAPVLDDLCRKSGKGCVSNGH